MEPPTGAHPVSPAVAGAAADGASGRDGEGEDEVPDVNSPAKIIRIGAMVKQLLEEVRTTSLDEASRGQLRDIYERSLDQLKSSLSPELAEELTELSFDFPEGSVPSETELRMAQSQLVGWLEGLFHGIQAALVAQQMSARQQLEGMRGQLMQGPGGPQPTPTPGGPGYI
ncbi:bacterial proteasome activator family protein [Dermatobacter hominis]|nr:bacterial proteasome activator family protein [Dermatobacter hominis]